MLKYRDTGDILTFYLFGIISIVISYSDLKLYLHEADKDY